MKKIIYTISLLLVSFTMTAENPKAGKVNTTSEVKYYGAEKGDFSLSFSALPVIDFIGNMFNGTTSQSFTGFGSITPSVFNGTSLSTKYFFSNRMNVTVGAGFNCFNNESYTYADDYEIMETVKTVGTNEVMFLIGSQYLLCPGKRLQPVVGANLVYAYSNKNYEKIDDKEEINADINHKSPQSTYGLIANLGVEFFFCKSVSMSTSLDLAVMRTTSKCNINDWDRADSYITSRQTKFITGKLGGNLAINFYF